jgi:hypothetical protein
VNIVINLQILIVAKTVPNLLSLTKNRNLSGS